MSAKSRAKSFTRSSLLCKNDCGFYGNASWEGYCSLCWRQLNRNTSEALNEEVSPWFDLASIVSFEDKKKSDSKRSSLSKIFNLSPEDSPRRVEERTPRHVLALVDKKTKEFLTRHAKKNYAPDVLGEHISTFYDNLVHLVSRKVEHDEEVVHICVDRAEELLTDALYTRLFALEEDETSDLGLQKAIRQFHWIGPAMLGAQIDRSLNSVRDLIDEAVNLLLQTNSETMPREKLQRLSSAVDCIMRSLQASLGKPPGMDDIMPALIFLLLHTNPPLFKSNLALIRRLSPPENLRRGELAYHYCSICSAVQFIERGITEKDLNLTRHQFSQFVSNEVTPPLSLMEMDFSHIRQNDKIGGIFSVDESGTFTSPELERIVELKKKNEEFFSRARQLRKEMSEFSISVSKEVSDLIEKYPLGKDVSVDESSNPPETAQIRSPPDTETETSSQTSQKSI